MLGWLTIALGVLVGIFLLLTSDSPFATNLDGGDIAILVGGLILVLVYGASISADYRGRWVQAVRHAAIWAGVLLALVVAYSYRGELAQVGARVASEVVPPGQVMTLQDDGAGERAVRIRRRSNGHFNARGDVNGVSMSLLIDTGATTVVLKPADAERAGIDTGALAFTAPVQTANGTTFAAPVRIRSIAIGPIEVRDVEALVAQPGSLNESLLGMSFLRRLRSYEFSGDFLTLRG